MPTQVPLATDLPALCRLLRQRFAGREAVLAALLQALTGQPELGGITPLQMPRLAALLATRSDEELERIARRGHAGRMRWQFSCELEFDGEPTVTERAAMARRLLGLLQQADWVEPGVQLRSVLLGTEDEA